MKINIQEKSAPKSAPELIGGHVYKRTPIRPDPDGCDELMFYIYCSANHTLVNLDGGTVWNLGSGFGGKWHQFEDVTDRVELTLIK